MPIISAVDQSERAETVIKQGREFADVYGVELHVVHVGSHEFDTRAIPTEGGVSANYQPPSVDAEEAREEATEFATELAERVKGHGSYQAIGLVRDPAEKLISYSRDHDAECIVVSTRKRSRLGQVLFGSVTQSMLLSADRPVVAVPHEGE